MTQEQKTAFRSIYVLLLLIIKGRVLQPFVFVLARPKYCAVFR
jgi:hypothetical protein